MRDWVGSLQDAVRLLSSVPLEYGDPGTVDQLNPEVGGFNGSHSCAFKTINCPIGKSNTMMFENRRVCRLRFQRLVVNTIHALKSVFHTSVGQARVGALDPTLAVASLTLAPRTLATVAGGQVRLQPLNDCGQPLNFESRFELLDFLSH